MNRAEKVQAILWFDQIAAAAKEEAARFREQISAEARADFEADGTAPTWRIPELATIAATVTHQAVTVADEGAFAAWVQRRYPTEVEMVAQIRPAWKAHLLASSTPAGEVVCTPDGEVIPGLAVRQGGALSGVSIRPTAAAKEVFGDLARTSLQRLALDAGPAVPLEVADADA